MNFPLLSEYVEAIKLSKVNLNQLSDLIPVLDKNGIPVMSMGEYAVVFKMHDERNCKFYALKCFIKDQEERNESYKQIADELEYVSSSFLTPIKFFEKELFVDTLNSEEHEFPVLIMDWVDGITLDKYVRENIGDQYKLSLLAFRFSRLAMWLMPQPFAHGDLKPENIIVRENGSIVLVDYDGMYVPAMKGKKARELGSPDFRHPSRTENDFDDHIDDFSLVSILLSLKAIAQQPSLFDEYGSSGRLLFGANDYRDISQSELIRILFPSIDPELNILMSLFTISLEKLNLKGISSNLFYLSRIQPIGLESSRTTITENDIACSWTDEYGVIYSEDGKRLLRGVKQFSTSVVGLDYKIRNGVLVICDSAFYNLRDELICVTLPESVKYIGKLAFYGCRYLEDINIPQSVSFIGESVFSLCHHLNRIQVSRDNRVYDSRGNCNAVIHSASNMLVSGCHNTVIPNTVTHIGNYAFDGCESLITINIPDSVTHIGNYAFSRCRYLSDVFIPGSVRYLGDCVFDECISLSNINIPSSVTHIGDYAFNRCESMTDVYIPHSVIHIGVSVFCSCSRLASIQVSRNNSEYDSRENCNAVIQTASNMLVSGCYNTIIPDTVTQIGEGAFQGCDSLTTVTIPDSVTHIGNYAFSGCKNLTRVIIPNSVTHIGEGAFNCCDNMTVISLPDKLTSIENETFRWCDKLIKVTIPNSVSHIGTRAFSECSNLTEVIIPNSIKYIGEYAFTECKNLTSVTIPNSIIQIDKDAFDLTIEHIYVPYGSYSKFLELLGPEYESVIKELSL